MTFKSNKTSPRVVRATSQCNTLRLRKNNTSPHHAQKQKAIEQDKFKQSKQDTLSCKSAEACTHNTVQTINNAESLANSHTNSYINSPPHSDVLHLATTEENNQASCCCDVNYSCTCQQEKFKDNSLLPTDDVDIITAFFKALSDPTRFNIVYALLQHQILSVGDIATITNMSMSAISHQLAILRMRKLVTVKRDGVKNYYTLCDDHVAQMVQLAIEHVHED